MTVEDERDHLRTENRSLQEQLRVQQAQLAEQEELIAQLQQRLQDLEERLAKTSRNSHLPRPPIGSCTSPRACGRRAGRSQGARGTSYTAAGKKAGSRLYTHSELNHEELFEIASRLQGDFLMTYDDTESVRSLARSYNFDTRVVPMKNTHHTKMTELLIGPNLEWLHPTYK